MGSNVPFTEELYRRGRWGLQTILALAEQDGPDGDLLADIIATSRSALVALEAVYQQGAAKMASQDQEEPMTPAEQLARAFHDRYEALAPNFGYETRPDTRAFEPTTPNGRLMIAVCEALIGGGIVRLLPGTGIDRNTSTRPRG